MKIALSLLQLIIAFVLLVVQESFFSEIFYQFFEWPSLINLKINFLFLIGLYFGYYRELEEGIVFIFFFGVLAAILSPYYFSFFPSYLITTFILAYFVRSFFLVGQLRLTWIFVLVMTIAIDALFLILLSEVKGIEAGSFPVSVLFWQGVINLLLFPLVKSIFDAHKRLAIKLTAGTVSGSFGQLQGLEDE